MKPLLIHKGIYTAEEFQQLFAEWFAKKKKSRTKQHAKTPFAEA